MKKHIFQKSKNLENKKSMKKKIHEKIIQKKGPPGVRCERPWPRSASVTSPGPPGPLAAPRAADAPRRGREPRCFFLFFFFSVVFVWCFFS